LVFVRRCFDENKVNCIYGRGDETERVEKIIFFLLESSSLKKNDNNQSKVKSFFYWM